jgi:hypothetical protein
MTVVDTGVVGSAAVDDRGTLRKAILDGFRLRPKTHSAHMEPIIGLLPVITNHEELSIPSIVVLLADRRLNTVPQRVE